MSNHLDGTYFVLHLNNSDSAYFLSIEESQDLDRLLDIRDTMAPEDRVETLIFTDLGGSRIRIFIDQIHSIQHCTPKSRETAHEINLEIQARNII